MQKITIINTVLLVGVMLHGGLRIQAAAPDDNNQKRIMGATAQQNAAATLIQAGVRGILARHTQRNREDNALQEALFDAVRNNRSEVIEGLLQRRAHCDAIDQKGNTPLILAARDGYIEIARILLAANANVDIASSFGNTPLIQAVRSGSVEIVRALLAVNANVTICNRLSSTPLMLAVKEGHVEIAKSLIDAYRAQLAKQYPETFMVIFDRDFEQFDRNPTVQSMKRVLYEVGEVITGNMAESDCRDLVNTGCSLLAKVAVNGNNGQSYERKIGLFFDFIFLALQQLILLKEKNPDNPQTINCLEEFLKQELEQGCCMRTSEPSCVVSATCVASAEGDHCDGRLSCAFASQAAQRSIVSDGQAGAAAVSQDGQARLALEAEGALRKTKEEELALSEAIDRRKAELEEQIGALAGQLYEIIARYTIVESTFDVAPLEIRKEIRDLYICIITARTELISLIHTTQTFHQIFATEKAARLAGHNEMLANERSQLEMAERAIDEHVLTEQELRAMQEQGAKMFGGNEVIDRKGKKPV